jgi:hypothetical protein
MRVGGTSRAEGDERIAPAEAELVPDGGVRRQRVGVGTSSSASASRSSRGWSLCGGNTSAGSMSPLTAMTMRPAAYRAMRWGGSVSDSTRAGRCCGAGSVIGRIFGTPGMQMAVASGADAVCDFEVSTTIANSAGGDGGASGDGSASHHVTVPRRLRPRASCTTTSQCRSLMPGS